MSRKFFKKMVAGAAVIALLANSSLFATEAAEAGTTYYGEKVTVNVGTDYVRENNFNKNWKFYLGTSSTAQNQGFDDSSWEDVDLPHDFSITQAFTSSGEAESGLLPGGTGWYRKSFTMPESAADQTILLNFDGVYSDAYVYVNGEAIGEHHHGYTSFAFDISEYLIYDGATENVIAVKAVNNIPSSRWYSGSGIYRNVTLIVTDAIHVDLNGTQITTPDISNGTGTVNIKVDVVNDGDTPKSVTVINTVTEKGSETVLATAEATVTAEPGATVTAETTPVVSSPKLWSVDHPNLYEVHTVLTVDGIETDCYDTTFGFRYFSFDNLGFHLNGQNLKLNGVCMHHDQGALGAAAYYDAIYRQMSIMKDMGCNAIRTAHNPASKNLIEICNELGMLVIEETFDGLVDAKNGNSNDFSIYFEESLGSVNELYDGSATMTYAEYAARSQVKRDRNAPSIIAWSFGNEIQEGTYWTNVSRYDDICANYITWVNDEDGTRPVTSGDNNRGGNADLVNVINTITNNGGIAGFNYANSASTLYSLAQSYGGSKGVIIASETSSATNSRSQYKNQNNNSDSDGAYHLTSYDTSSVSWGITAHDSIYNTYQYDCVAGEFVWTGFDYIGEPTPWNGTGTGDNGRGAIPNSSYFGIVETTGFEKDTYYLYRSQWNKEETTLHLVTAWDSDNYMLSNNQTPVWVYSNAPIVKLYRDGEHIGTATRNAVISDAGHTYYTYTTESNDTSICTTSSGGGADGLYAVFNVTYTAGTLSASAFEADGTTEISLNGNSGKNTVTTPGTVAKLAVSANESTVEADGSSLTYIEVDVTDASGNLDTTATNNIVFTLTGNGEIVGVDNGDQATTAKYQQSSVLTSSTSANINAYAGKALAIVRSTENAGSFTLRASSSGLTENSVAVETVLTDHTTQENGLISYTMIRDYSIKAGTIPTLDTSVTGIMADSSTISGTITWDEVTEEVYQNAGDYTLKGILTFNGLDPITVTGRLHVIANVIAMRNISTVTTVGVVPELASTVSGVLADGTLAGEFYVSWETVNADDLDTVGEIVVVNGTATVLGNETLPVTCSVRVAETVATESTNIASQADSLSQDIVETNQSDVLTSVTNGTYKPGDNTSERWTNWNNRTNSADATLTLTWATAHMLSGVNIYYYYDNCCAYPEKIEFSYSLNGVDYLVIDAESKLVEPYNLGAQYSYTFAEPINPVGLKIKFTQQSGTSGSHCVGVTEIEVMTYAATLEYNTSSDLSAIMVDGVAVENFAADTLSYEAVGSNVEALADANAGITILPEYEGVIRILTISEDSNHAKNYEVIIANESLCTHTNTEVRDVLEATCSKEGYTGDMYCTDCGEKLENGTAISMKEHTTAVVNAKSATCTENGYTGDLYCSVCDTTVSTGKTIAASGHSYDDCVTGEDGSITYTCTRCGDSYQKKELLAPKVSLTVQKTSDNKIQITGTFEDYENCDKYYEVTGKGLVYINTTRLGSRTLTVNTSGRTKVTCKTFTEDGSFSYTMKPASASTKYTIKAYLTYIDANGVSRYAYSSQVVTTLNQLSQ